MSTTPIGMVKRYHNIEYKYSRLPGSSAQSLARVTADPWDCKVESQLSFITTVEIDHGIFCAVILSFPLILRREVVSFCRNCLNEVLVNRLQD